MARPKPKLWLHIGHGKTGTTALQRHAVARGDLDPAFHYTRLGRTAEGTHLRFFTDPRVRPFGAGTGFPLLPQFRAETDSLPLGALSLLSAEHLVYFPVERIADLMAALSDFDLRVLYYIRRQDDLAESTFRWKQVTEPGRFTDPLAIAARGALDFEQRLAPFRMMLPDAAFSVRLYHDQTCARDIVADFQAALGLAPLDLPSAQPRLRVSLDSTRIRALMAHDRAHPRDRERSQVIARLEAEQAAAAQPDGAPFLNPDQRRRIMADHADSNRRIAQAFLSPRETALLLA